VGVADHGGDAGQCGDFFWSALGVTAGDDDFRQRVLALHAAYRSACVMIGGICDCTSIQDYEVGLCGRGARKTPVVELAFEGSAVGLSGATSEIFDVVGGHGMNQGYGSAWTHAVPNPARALSNFSSRKIEVRSGRGGGLLLREAFAAENGAALRGAEGDCGLLAALGTGGAGFDASVVVSVPVALKARGGEHSHALGLAGFAALGFVLELLVVEEQLFARGKNKLGATVDAGQYLVLKFH